MRRKKSILESTNLVSQNLRGKITLGKFARHSTDELEMIEYYNNNDNFLPKDPLKHPSEKIVEDNDLHVDSKDFL